MKFHEAKHEYDGMVLVFMEALKAWSANISDGGVAAAAVVVKRRVERRRWRREIMKVDMDNMNVRLFGLGLGVLFLG